MNLTKGNSCKDRILMAKIYGHGGVNDSWRVDILPSANKTVSLHSASKKP